MEPISKLNSYINSAIPYAWDDSESWFEFLGKVLAKVNEIIEKTNDYFDVDIKQFVVDTLSKWETDGTLATVINETIVQEKANITYVDGIITEVNTNVDKLATQLEHIGKDVRTFGAIGNANYLNTADGLYYEDSAFTVLSTDDTSAIQLALNESGNILLANGNFLIDPFIGLSVLSNTNIVFKNAKIVSKTTDLTEYALFQLNGIENVEMNNPVIVGDRETHIGTTGEWGHGLSILGSKGVTIYNPDISDCWGDGIYLGTHNDIINDNVNLLGLTKIKNCRRQGISVIAGINCKIEHLHAEDIDGTAPMAAIDFEPNNESIDVIKNFEVGKITAIGCYHATLFVVRRTKTMDVKIGDIHAIDCTNPIRFNQVSDGLSLEHGSIKIDNLYVNKVVDNNAVKLENTMVGYSPNITINNIVVDDFIVNPDAAFYWSVVVYHATLLTELTKSYGNFRVGNVTLNKTTIYSTQTETVKPLHIRRGVDQTHQIKDIQIVNFGTNALQTTPYSFTDFISIINCKLQPYADRLKSTTNSDLSAVVNGMSNGEFKVVDYDSGRSGTTGYPTTGRGLMFILRHTTQATFIVFDAAYNKVKYYNYNISTEVFSSISEFMTQAPT